jgi:hypothetical protein
LIYQDLLIGDHGRGLRQGQRKIAQLGGHRPGTFRISRAGPLGEEGERIGLGKHIHRHVLQSRFSGLCPRCRSA